MIRLLLVLALVFSPCALADGPSDEHRRVVSTLLLAKRVFPTRAQVLRTGRLDDTQRILIDLADDTQAEVRLQLNAVRALEYFPTKTTEEVLMTLLYTRGQTVAHRRAILRALARAFGVKMYFEVLPFLRDVDPRIRSGAAMALAEIDDGRVRSMLLNLIESEPEIEVRLAAEQGLALVEAREKAAAGARTPAGTPLDE